MKKILVSLLIGCTVIGAIGCGNKVTEVNTKEEVVEDSVEIVESKESKEVLGEVRSIQPKMNIVEFDGVLFAEMDAIAECDNIFDGKYKSNDSVVYYVESFEVKIGQKYIPLGIYEDDPTESPYALVIGEDNKTFLVCFLDGQEDELEVGDRIMIKENIISKTLSGIGVIVIGTYDVVN